MTGGILQFLHGQLLETPPLPTGDLSRKTIIVTGANSGLALDACKHILRLHPARLILACRSAEKGATAQRALDVAVPAHGADVQVWSLDMTDAESMSAFARRCDAELERLDAVILSAGLMADEFRATGPARDSDESMVAVHAIGTSLLALLLLPKLRATAVAVESTATISVVGTAVHAFADTDSLTTAPAGEVLKTVTEWARAKYNARDQYNLSKLVALLCTRQLAAAVSASGKPGARGVIVNTVHPGYCRTPFFGAEAKMSDRVGLALMGRECEEGSRCLVDGILKGRESHGQYLAECKIKPASDFVRCEKRGGLVGEAVWREVLEKLEAIQPGVAGNV